MRMSMPRRLSVQLAVASLVSASALASVCFVGILSLDDVGSMTRDALDDQTAVLNEASAFEALLYDKGFVANYFLSHDRAWLHELTKSREAFGQRLERAIRGSTNPEAAELLRRIQAEHGAYDRARAHAIGLFEAGQQVDAMEQLRSVHDHIERILALCQDVRRLGRLGAERTHAAADARLVRLRWTLVATSFLGALASLAVGYLLARRVAKPIYELQLQVESAAQRTRIHIPEGVDGLDAVGEQVSALVQKLEEVDATLLDQRKRLIQSEKLSAMGEMAAKLAHEVLNPLAGIKAAVQRLARRGLGAPPDGEEVVRTADVLGSEIARVEDLVRRLMDYARPLRPRIEVCTVAHLVDLTRGSVAHELVGRKVELVAEIEPDLPPIEADPTLLVQTLGNLVRNAAEAMPDGGLIQIRARTVSELGRRHLAVAVLDEGTGLCEEHQAGLFRPFFTTKAKGHGLGLAVCQNVVLEHGGRISARNRDDRPGAVFELLLPLVR